jgi:transcriptional regulator GlxA family with amidase domain
MMCKDPAMSVHRVAVLVLAPVVGFDAAIAPLLFGSAVDGEGRALYGVTVAGLEPGPVAGVHGYDLVPGADVSALAQADTVIIPGTRISGPRTDGSLPSPLRAALALIPPGARIVSICTGAFVLGAAGLLDGRPATTHWAHAAAFRALYPRVLLDEDLLFVDDGDVLTSAGLAAGVDLCLHVIRRDHGTAVANHVARYCVVPPWRAGGQAQFIERPVPEAAEETTASTRAWALEHLDERLDVAQLADRTRMSVRTFNRRFRQETGVAPGAWLAEQRIQHAMHLLETTDLRIDDVARSTGLGTGANLRQRMQEVVGVSPVAYRRTFRGAVPA